MSFHVGDILSVPLIAHTRHFCVYIGDGTVVEWGPEDDRSWMGGKGMVSRACLVPTGDTSTYRGRDGGLLAIRLEQRTGADRAAIEARIAQMTPGIDYDLGDRNCEHFATYVTGHGGRSGQSGHHGFTDYAPFTSQPTFHTFQQLREELLRCTFCGYLQPTRDNFDHAVFVHALEGAYYVYHLSHALGGQHLYVTTVQKADDLEASYQ